ncbi:hypothetical protein [Lacticaseibacillus paracasei]|uniref:hypothetical protein n=1 Tax=Lacticaseibacillus paracasei TaxID=1597 RepID=UPI0016126C8E|nr:hypothetical protein [Lacticaseibacillus paracasei]
MLKPRQPPKQQQTLKLPQPPKQQQMPKPLQHPKRQQMPKPLQHPKRQQTLKLLPQISKRTHQDIFGIEMVDGVDLMDNSHQNKRY